MENHRLILCFLFAGLIPVERSTGASSLIIEFPGDKEPSNLQKLSAKGFISLHGSESEYFSDELLNRFDQILESSTLISQVEVGPTDASYFVECSLAPIPVSSLDEIEQVNRTDQTIAEMIVGECPYELLHESDSKKVLNPSSPIWHSLFIRQIFGSPRHTTFYDPTKQSVALIESYPPAIQECWLSDEPSPPDAAEIIISETYQFHQIELDR